MRDSVADGTRGNSADLGSVPTFPNAADKPSREVQREARASDRRSIRLARWPSGSVDVAGAISAEWRST